MQRSKVVAFIDFIVERHCVYIKKEAAEPRPWTQDKILQQYKFCNVYRELDRTTQWIARNWRNPHQEDPDLWFAMLVARCINHIGTLAELGYPVPWDAKHFKQVFKARQARGEKLYSKAYMQTTNHEAIDKLSFNLRRFSDFWKRRKELRPIPGTLLDLYARHMQEQKSLGSFMVGQIIADIKYAAPHLNDPDWWSFAVPGPGSRRGMNRILGDCNTAKELNRRIDETVWLVNLCKLSDIVRGIIPASMPRIHNQDLQNCLCEWDKYRRIQAPTVGKRGYLRLYKGE